MTVRDLTPEQRRELLAAWDAAVRVWWSDRDIQWRRYTHERERMFSTWDRVGGYGLSASIMTPEFVARGL